MVEDFCRRGKPQQFVLRGQGFVDAVNNNTKMVDKEQR